MSVVGDTNVDISGRDVASFFYNTESGVACLTGLVYWLFRWKVTRPEDELRCMIWPYRESYFINSFLQSRIVTDAPEVVKLLPKQRFKNSCGAQALRQAALDLGLSHVPVKEIYKFQGQSIEDSSAEEAIYGITGDLLDPGMKQPLMPPEDGGYSLPDRMLVAARELGLGGRFYCSSLFTRCYLKLNYPEEWGRASALSPVKHSSPPKLSLNERCIHAVKCKSSSALHWIMERPDGRCYDPIDAHLYTSLEAYKQACGFSSTGVSLLISDRNAYPGGVNQVVGSAASEFNPALGG